MELLKSQFCISNVLLHLLFCGSSLSAPDNCNRCSRSHVYYDCHVYRRRFVSCVRYNFTSILPITCLTELLFARPEVEVRRIDLDLLYPFKDY